MAEYTVDKDELLRLIRHDCETFLAFYIGPELTLGVPEFHKELWDEFLELLEEVNNPQFLVGILKKLLGVPREHAKTTLVKLAVLLLLRYSRLTFCAYVSNTFPSAHNAIKDIKTWMESEQECQLYGEPRRIKSSESEGIYIMDIWVPGQMKPKRVIMKAFGQGTQIRGMLIDSKRPDLLIFDDIESDETAGSPIQQAKLDKWALGTALKAMAKMGVCIFIGNMIQETSLLARLSKEKEWRPTVFGSIIRAKDGTIRALWEERWTLEALLLDYGAFRRLGTGHVWEAEMMNLTGKDILGEKLDNAIRLPRPLPDQIEAGFICLDPAFGLKAWNDESAITVHVRLHGGDVPLVAESVHGRFSEERLFDEMLATSFRWGIRTWVIEAVAAQRLLIPLFRSYLIQRGMSPDMLLMLPIIAGKESKASRIVAFRSSAAAGSYGIAEEEQELVTKLEEYSPDTVKHDDLCDSAAFGTLIWNVYGTLVESQGTSNVAGMLMGVGITSSSYGMEDMGIP